MKQLADPDATGTVGLAALAALDGTELGLITGARVNGAAWSRIGTALAPPARELSRTLTV